MSAFITNIREQTTVTHRAIIIDANELAESLEAQGCGVCESCGTPPVVAIPIDNPERWELMHGHTDACLSEGEQP